MENQPFAKEGIHGNDSHDNDDKNVSSFLSRYFLSRYLKKEKTNLTNILATLETIPPVVWQRYTTETVTRIWRMAAIVAAEDRHKLFLHAADELEWGPRTMDTYWATVLTLLRLLNMAQSEADRAMSAKCKKAASEAPGWDLEGVILSQTVIDNLPTWAANAGPRHPISAAYVAFVWGQRLADVMKMAPDNVYTVGDRTSVIVTEGKTVPKTGAYTLSISSTHFMAHILRESVKAAARAGQSTIFDSDYKRILEISGKLDMRAFRRTGLSMMAMAGAETDTLLAFSRHTSSKMLEVYLMRGLFHAAMANKMCQVINDMGDVALPQLAFKVASLTPSLC